MQAMFYLRPQGFQICVLKLSFNLQVSADILYFAVSARVYFLSNSVGIHVAFCALLSIHPS
jgi:hypothetical protein